MKINCQWNVDIIYLCLDFTLNLIFYSYQIWELILLINNLKKNLLHWEKSFIRCWEQYSLATFQNYLLGSNNKYIKYK